ncbi:MAG: TonB-dependent receptor [Candidatus Zixiibacteriota bacterium]
MRRSVIVALVLFAVGAVVHAATLTGVVVDRNTGGPLAGATVSMEGRNKSLATDADGRFAITYDSGVPLTLSVSHVGYRTRRNLSADGGELRVELEPAASVLDNVVVTANRYEKEAYRTAQPVTVTGTGEIQNKGYTIVSDVIRSFPGVDMNDAGPFRARPVIRGLYGTRILVLVDGERLNDQRDISSFAGVSMSLVDPNDIERVEVVNGPSSVLYGSDAMGGVINIITRKNSFNSTLKPFATYSGRYSTADQQHSNRLDVGVEAQRWVTSFGFQYREANKDYQPPDGWNSKPEFFVYRPGFYDSLNARTGYDFSRDRLVNSRARVNNYEGKLAYKLAERQRLDLDLNFFRGNDIGYPGVPNDSTPFLFVYPNHDRQAASLTYTARGLSSHLAKLESRLYFDRITKDFLTDFLGSLVIPAGPPPNPPTITPLTATNHTEVTKYGLNFQELYALGPRLNLTSGFDFLHEAIDGDVVEITRFDGFGPFPFNDTTRGSSVPKNNWNSLGLFASGEINLAPLLVTAGLRYDNFWINTNQTPGYEDDSGKALPTQSEHYNSVNGSLGLVYNIGGGANLVANVGTAYRVPNVVERFYYGSASGRQTRPNPDIKPERSVSIDYGVKAIHPHVNYSLIGFYSLYNDFTQLQTYDSLPPSSPGAPYTPLWRYENLEDVRIYGFEGVVEGNFDFGLYGNLNLAYQHGQIRSADQPLFVSPVKLGVTAGYRHKKYGAFGEANLRVVGDQNRVPDVAYLDDIPSKGFTVVNATVGFRPWNLVRLSLSANNIFDKAYAEPFNARNPDNPIAEPGRNFVVSMTANL